jgi:hypothetical protein
VRITSRRSSTEHRDLSDTSSGSISIFFCALHIACVSLPPSSPGGVTQHHPQRLRRQRNKQLSIPHLPPLKCPCSSSSNTLSTPSFPFLNSGMRRELTTEGTSPSVHLHAHPQAWRVHHRGRWRSVVRSLVGVIRGVRACGRGLRRIDILGCWVGC